LPSYYEGLPNVLLDAINYGIPCISTNCSGAQDILANGKGGFIIPVNNRDKLEKTIKFAINNYPLALKKAGYAKKYTHKFSKNNLIKFKKIFINTYKSK